VEEVAGRGRCAPEAYCGSNSGTRAGAGATPGARARETPLACLGSTPIGALSPRGRSTTRSEAASTATVIHADCRHGARLAGGPYRAPCGAEPATIGSTLASHAVSPTTRATR
jgi:hypothetical protein